MIAILIIVPTPLRIALAEKNFLIPVYRLLPLGYHDLHNLIVMLINPSANKLKNKSTKPNGFVDLFFCLIKHKKSIR